MTSVSDSTTAGKPYLQWMIAAALIVLLIRLVSLWHNTTELFFDEAQYWFWSREPAFGYFSKPPVLAWIIAGVSGVCGSDSTFCVRLASPLVHTATTVVIFFIARELFNAKTGFWASAVYLLMPGVSLSSTLISTDVPLLFFWAVALYGFVRLWNDGSWHWVILCGLAIGFGLNSKYAMIYFPLCGFLFLFGKGSGTSIKFKFLTAVVLGLLMLVPNYIWNQQHAFVTVSHTGENIGWQGIAFNVNGMLEFLGSQFGVFGPIAFGIFLATLVRIRNPQLDVGHQLLVCFSLPVIAIILFQALASKAYANWAAAAYVAAAVLVADIMTNRVPAIWLKLSNGINLFIFVGLSVAVLFAGPGQLVLPNGKEPYKRMQGSSELASEIESELDKGIYKAVIFTDRRLAALMNYKLRSREEALLSWRADSGPRDHYQLVSAYQKLGLTPALLVSAHPKTGHVTNKFGEVEPLGQRYIPAGEIESLFLFGLDKYEAGN